MIVREMTEADIPAVVEMGKAAHAESPRYSRYPYVQAKVDALIAMALNPEQAVVLLVAEQAGELTGYVAGLVTEHYFSDARYGATISLYVSPKWRGSSAALRLLECFQASARELGAREILLSASSGAYAEQAARLYHALGYTDLGLLTIKFLE